MYIYKNTGKDVYVVGHYAPDGLFITESVYPEKENAIERVHYLNGVIDPDVFRNMVEDMYAISANTNFLIEDLNQRLDRAARSV